MAFGSAWVSVIKAPDTLTMNKYDYVTKTMQIMDFEDNTKHAHEDYMYVQEDNLVTRQEAFDDLKEYFEGVNKILSSKLLFEDEDLKGRICLV